MSDFKSYDGTNIELGLRATSTSDGLMSSDEKNKLGNISAGANLYTHPATHPASIIVEDASHRFVTDTEKSTWNSKASTAVATTTANGLMTSAMVTKLNGIAAGANAYTHPTTHPASMITPDATRRFVTDTQISTWNAKAGTAVATTSANGLMSASDKVKLNNSTFEYGSNTNGFYRKYGDGTLEMWGTKTLSYTSSLWIGTLSNSGFQYSTNFNITLPVTALNTATHVQLTVESPDVSWASIAAISTTNISYKLICPEPDKMYEAKIHWTAFGRWK